MICTTHLQQVQLCGLKGREQDQPRWLRQNKKQNIRFGSYFMKTLGFLDLRICLLRLHQLYNAPKPIESELRLIDCLYDDTLTFVGVQKVLQNTKLNSDSLRMTNMTNT